MIPNADPIVAAVGHPGAPGAAAEVETGAAVADGVVAVATAAGELVLVLEPPHAVNAVTKKNAASAKRSNLARDVRDASRASTFDAISLCIQLPSEHCIERFALVRWSIMAWFCRRTGRDSEIVRAKWRRRRSITQVSIL